MTRWLNLALALAVLSLGATGCYASRTLSVGRDAGSGHDAARPDSGGPDAGAPDAGLCGEPLPSTVGGLTCPSLVAPGEPVLVTVQHASSSCCSEDAARLVPQRTGPRSFALETSWDSCGCCELCACIGPTVRQALDLGPLEAGTWTVVADAARGFTCTIEVRALECRPRDITDALAPTAVLLGEPVPVLLTAPGLSCGCTPRGFYRFGREGGTYVGLEACGCSDLDPCVDSRYEATALVEGATELGRWGAMTSVGAVETQIADPLTCGEALGVLSFAPLGVDRGAIHDSPVGVFAHVEYEATYCCAAPMPIAREIVGGEPGVRSYDLINCVGYDCDCDPGGPRRGFAVVYLGQFPPGPQRIRIGGFDTTIDVPSG